MKDTTDDSTPKVGTAEGQSVQERIRALRGDLDKMREQLETLTHDVDKQLDLLDGEITEHDDEFTSAVADKAALEQKLEDARDVAFGSLDDVYDLIRAAREAREWLKAYDPQSTWELCYDLQLYADRAERCQETLEDIAEDLTP